MLCFFIVLSLQYCLKPELKQELKSISESKEFSDDQALLNISKRLFENQLKDYRVLTLSNSKKKLILDYGGTTALTFHQKDEYIQSIQLNTAKYLLRLFKYGQNRNLEVVQISLVKPYFIKDPSMKTELVEEVEVMRVSLNIESLKKIPGWETIDEFSEDKGKNPNPDLKNVLEKLIQLWDIELNELHRVEIK